MNYIADKEQLTGCDISSILNIRRICLPCIDNKVLLFSISLANICHMHYLLKDKKLQRSHEFNNINIRILYFQSIVLLKVYLHNPVKYC